MPRLPLEILQEVVAVTTSRRDHRSWALTCKALTPAAQRVIFSTLRLVDHFRPPKRVSETLRRMSSSPWLFSYVRTLVAYSGSTGLVVLFKRLSNLRNLHLFNSSFRPWPKGMDGVNFSSLNILVLESGCVAAQLIISCTNLRKLVMLDTSLTTERNEWETVHVTHPLRSLSLRMSSQMSRELCPLYTRILRGGFWSLEYLRLDTQSDTWDRHVTLPTINPLFQALREKLRYLAIGQWLDHQNNYSPNEYQPFFISNFPHLLYYEVEFPLRWNDLHLNRANTINCLIAMFETLTRAHPIQVLSIIIPGVQSYPFVTVSMERSDQIWARLDEALRSPTLASLKRVIIWLPSNATGEDGWKTQWLSGAATAGKLVLETRKPAYDHLSLSEIEELDSLC
ncbi:hypothetical protein DL96DRAFT_867310 [Flagelloscypha sp. PMI_526]|nr:hypothetical protein DL96DRAFT_867310 [Flagelloscypha sp. PMI_526]